MYDTRILVADDVALMRELLRSILRGLGHDVVTEAADGRAALECMRGRDAPEVAFIDINMPDLDGIQVLREARRTRPGLFVVLISAEGSVEMLRRAIAAGADAFVVKPFRTAKIREAMAKFGQARASG